MHRYVNDTGQEQFELGESGVLQQQPAAAESASDTQRTVRGDNMIDKSQPI